MRAPARAHTHSTVVSHTRVCIAHTPLLICIRGFVSFSLRRLEVLLFKSVCHPASIMHQFATANKR